MTKHTPEPWQAVPLEDDHWSVESVDMRDGDYAAEAYSEANARRIVACVNACAGAPTEALEQGAIAEALTLLDDAIASLHDAENPDDDAFLNYASPFLAKLKADRHAMIETIAFILWLLIQQQPACATDIECESLHGPEPTLAETRDC